MEQEATYKEEYVVTDPEERVRLEEIVESGKTVKYKNVMSPNGNSTTEKKYYRYNKEAKEARRKLNAKHEVVEYKDFAVIFGENGANINGNKVHEIGEAETFVDVFNTVYLEEDDQYDYKKQKMMGKLASIAVAIAATALTGGAGAALFGTVGTGALVAGAAVNGMISAAIPQLINKAIDSQNDIDVGSIIKSVAIAGMTYGFDKARLTGDVSKADGWAKAGVAMKNATFNAGLNSLANGTDFDDEFKSSLVADLAKLGANWIGDNYEGKTGNPDALFNGFTHKLAHGVLGCAGGYAATGNSSGCESGAVGGFMGELMAEGVAYATASEGQNALETNRFRDREEYIDEDGNIAFREVSSDLANLITMLGQLGAVLAANTMDLNSDIASSNAEGAIRDNVFASGTFEKRRGYLDREGREFIKNLIEKSSKFKNLSETEMNNLILASQVSKNAFNEELKKVGLSTDYLENIGLSWKQFQEQTKGGNFPGYIKMIDSAIGVKKGGYKDVDGNPLTRDQVIMYTLGSYDNDNEVLHNNDYSRRRHAEHLVNYYRDNPDIPILLLSHSHGAQVIKLFTHMVAAGALNYNNNQSFYENTSYNQGPFAYDQYIPDTSDTSDFDMIANGNSQNNDNSQNNEENQNSDNGQTRDGYIPSTSVLDMIANGQKPDDDRQVQEIIAVSNPERHEYNFNGDAFAPGANIYSINNDDDFVLKDGRAEHDSSTWSGAFGAAINAMFREIFDNDDDDASNFRQELSGKDGDNATIHYLQTDGISHNPDPTQAAEAINGTGENNQGEGDTIVPNKNN